MRGNFSRRYGSLPVNLKMLVQWPWEASSGLSAAWFDTRSGDQESPRPALGSAAKISTGFPTLGKRTFRGKTREKHQNANSVENTDSGLVTSVRGGVFVPAFWGSKPCFFMPILPKSYPLVPLLKGTRARRSSSRSRARTQRGQSEKRD